MKKFEKYLLEQVISEAKESAVFQLGRFNPITKGHQENVEFGKNYAKKNNSDYMLFTTQTQDSIKNPLTFETKTKYLEKFFDVKVNKDKSIKSAFQALEYLGKIYSDVTFIVGEDRVEEFKNQMSKYASQWGVTNFKVQESGKRTAGVSGTDMRNYVKLNQYDKFKDNLPSTATDNDAEELFELVKIGLKIK